MKTCEPNIIEQARLKTGITLKVDKMFCLPDAGSLKGFAGIWINDVLLIKGTRIILNKKGELSVDMPREQGKDDRWYDQVTTNDPVLREALSEVVLKEYRKITL